MRYILLFTFTLFIVTLSFRSPLPFDAKGVVTDASSGSPIAGVTVTLKGTPTATVTGSDGKFSLKINQQKALLVFAAVGYETTEKTVIDNGKEIPVALKPATQKLEEVVVTGS